MASIGGFFRTLKVIWQFGDALAPLLEHLVETLPQAGQSMIDGGNSAIMVSKALRAQGGLPTNAQQTVANVAAAVDQSRAFLTSATEQLRATADEINDVKVPTLSPTYHTFNFSGLGLGTWELVTGLGLSTTKPFRDFHDALDEAAGLIDDVNGRLAQAVANLTGLSNALETAGSNLHAVGQSLKTGGEALRQIA